MTSYPGGIESKIGLLKDEYLLLQKFYEDYDARIMGIKGWSTTICLAALGGGFYQSKLLWLFAAGSGIVFWILDAVWKSFQYNYSPRIVIFEEAFRSGNLENIEPLQIYTSWFRAHRSNKLKFLRSIGMTIVWFPHIIPVIAGPTLFFLEQSGVFTIARH